LYNHLFSSAFFIMLEGVSMSRRRAQHSRYSGHPYQYRREGCFSRIGRFFLNLFYGLIIGGLAVLLVGFVVTHFQQTIAFIVSLFAFLSFLISIFPQILHYGFIVGCVFAGLGLLYGLVRLISAISERLAEASAKRARAGMEKARLKQEKERAHQAKIQSQREQVRLAQTTFDYDQRMRDRYRPPQPEGQQPRRTRSLQEVPQASQTSYRTRNLQDLPQPSQPGPQPSAPLAIPSISQLLGPAIAMGQADMLNGFEFGNGELIAIRGELPVTAIVAGKGRSGKSRRMMLMIFQAILMFQSVGGGKITICDPHWMKPDGLSNVLAPFAPWVSFARTDDEIIAAAKEHITEFESRLTANGSLNGEGLMLRLIIIDEFSKLMKSEDISKRDKQILTKCVRETSVQWGGVGGRAWIAGQEFTEDAIGDTAIRKGAQSIYCHQLSDEYTSFLFPRDTRAQRMAQHIARRECIYKDSDNVVKKIITPTVFDEEINSMAAYLARYVPQMSRRRTRQISQRPPTRPIQQQGAPFMAQTEDLTPKQPTIPVAPTQQPASAIWQDPAQDNDSQRRQYGHTSRPLHKNRLTAPPQQPAPTTPQTRTTENLTQAIQEADGSPDDTVLVPELSQPQHGRPQFVLPISGKFPAIRPTAPAPISPATNELVKRPPEPQLNQFSRLTQVRKKQKK
jgi:hypothetical protein